MKALCHREGLLSAFQLVNAAVPGTGKQDIKPILKNFKAVADEDRCTLMATDLELGIRLEVRGLKVEEPGEAILPAKRMMDILRETQDEELSLEADASACRVRSAYGSWEMASEDPSNFPDLPAFTEEQYHQMEAGTLREMIRRTVFVATNDAGRYAYNGVLWELEDSRARLVASDGKRLALSEGAAVAHGDHTTRGQTPVVPAKAMSLLERNLQDDDEQVRVCFRQNDVRFRTERAVIYSQLLQGRFPPYREIFTKKQTLKVPLLVAPFLAAVRQAAIMADEETRKVLFHIGKKKLTLEAQGREMGHSKVELPIDYEGKTVDIGFNPVFLVDMLRVLAPDTPLILELIDGNSPATFRTEDQYSYLVMPLS